MARDADGHACGMIPSALGGHGSANWDGRLDETDGVYDPDHDYEPADSKDDDD